MTVHSACASVSGRRRVAVVGSGVSGLAAAWRLAAHPKVDVHLLEAGSRFGGHAHTVPVTLPGRDGRPVTHGVDVGFLVYNERTYPGFIALLRTLGIEGVASDMSFSVQAPRGLDGQSDPLEWSGSSLNSVFAQRRNLASPLFWRMLRDILRFNRLASALARHDPGGDLQQPLAGFLARHGFSQAFTQGYLLPMLACIWSCPLDQMLAFPLATLVRFCDNHGLLQVSGRPRWFSVPGGSARYVQAMVDALPQARLHQAVSALRRGRDGRLCLRLPGSEEQFDAVVLACHAPQALALLGDAATAQEREVLGAFRTQANLAVLHTDARLMPTQRRAWAAWNFERGADLQRSARAPVCLHYWINRLQPLPFDRPVLVSLNPLRQPTADSVIARFEPAHPVFDNAAIRAQAALPSLQGRAGVWFAGAWCGHGFHEDGLQAGLAAADGVLRQAGIGGADAAASPNGMPLAEGRTPSGRQALPQRLAA